MHEFCKYINEFKLIYFLDIVWTHVTAACRARVTPPMPHPYPRTTVPSEIKLEPCLYGLI